MRILKLLMRGLVATLLFILMAGCLTPAVPFDPKDSPIKTDSTEGLSATLRFMDEATLKKKFRKEINPFLTDYDTIRVRRVMVFELTVKNQRPDPAQFIMNQIELQFGGKDIQPYNRFHLAQHWEFTDEQRKTKGSDKAMRDNIIENNVLPNTYTLPAQGLMRGYLVFVGNVPNYGTARICIPVFATKSEVLHRFEFNFEF